MAFRKVYIVIDVKFLPDGSLRPLKIYWEDGRVYEVDRLIDVRRAASLKAGGAGVRYTCEIDGKETYLFYEVDRWFVEAKY